MTTFKEMNISESLQKALADARFESPTEIQAKAIPLVVAGEDVIGQASTGSGKTLAFAASIVERVVPGKGVQALVMTPTRELAEQVSQSLKKFSKYTKLFITEVYGGVAMSPQVDRIEKADVVVGTPGRILDHMRQGTLSLKKVTHLILDEADRMLDMGFIDDMKVIIEACPKERQTLLFSATISQDIEVIGKRYMHNPQTVEVDSYVDPSKLTQVYYDTPQNLKFSLLVHLLKQEPEGLVMVFCNTRSNADFITDNLKRYEIDAMAIHGGLSQNKRSRTLESFHRQKVQVLVCTDVAARGLDIKNVSHVYNYDMPPNPKDYIHRIGRTARAGKEGKAINIVSQRDYDNFRAIMHNDELKITPLEIPNNLEQIYVKFERRGFGGGRGNFRGGGRSFGGRGGRSERPSYSARSGSRSGRDYGRRPSYGQSRSDSRRDKHSNHRSRSFSRR